MPTDFMVIVKEVNDLKGRYKIVLGEAGGVTVTVFCDTGSEIFGVIFGFYQKGQITVRHPFSIITGPLINQSSQEFKAKHKEGERLRKEYEEKHLPIS